MKALYFDCFSGAAGDMMLGALLDAGASEEAVRSALGSLGIGGFDLQVRRVNKGAIAATKVDILISDHTTERTYADIVALLESAPLTERVATLARRTFRIAAEAESKVHGVPLEQVHFHEIGALDSIADIVGSCAAFSDHAPDFVGASPLPAGRGTARSEHGPIPLPAPAVTEILARAAAPVDVTGEDELVTPTGAALLAAFVNSFGPMPLLRLSAVGYGAGTQERAVPNVLRVLVGEITSTSDGAPGRLIETNIDDMSGELLAYVIDALLANGAQDAWATPIVMKKGRPAYTLSILTDAAGQDALLDVLFTETTTLGARMMDVSKEALERKATEVMVEGHPVRLKVGRRRGRVVTVTPEYEDAAAAARATGLPLKEIYARALDTARQATPT